MADYLHLLNGLFIIVFRDVGAEEKWLELVSKPFGNNWCDYSKSDEVLAVSSSLYRKSLCFGFPHQISVLYLARICYTYTIEIRTITNLDNFGVYSHCQPIVDKCSGMGWHRKRKRFIFRFESPFEKIS